MKTRLIALAVSICILGMAMTNSGYAQIIPPYDLGGASKPAPIMSLTKKEGQYKRVHQTALRLILRGELDKTQTFLEEYLEKHENDAETLYMLGVLHGQKAEIETAEDYLKKSLAAGLPPGRLVAGPRTVFEPLAETKTVRDLMETFQTKLVHGPMLGNVTESSASFWGRTSDECDAVVVIFDAKSQQEIARSSVERPQETDDFTFVATISGLVADSEYLYQVKLGGVLIGKKHPFKTFAKADRPKPFSFAFGGGAGYVPQNERMWNTIEDCEPDALLLLGDNVYIDDPESIVMQQYTYQRRQSRPEWRQLTASHPVFTIWDDHDFSTNDSRGGPDIEIPFWKNDWVYPIFRQNWVNPGYGGGYEQPGCWYSFSIGDVDFIMLDCRYYRTNPKDKPCSMLGPVQLQWLKEELKKSKGTFKVLCSSVPWDFRTKGGSLDTWNGYREEHEEIFRYIETNSIEGVVLVSADRHRSDCWKLERPNGYDLYEFNSSRLTNQHIHPTMEKQGAIFSFNKPQSFGLVSFDTTLEDPTVTYEIVDINGKRPHSITVRLSELQLKE